LFSTHKLASKGKKLKDKPKHSSGLKGKDNKLKTVAVFSTFESLFLWLASNFVYPKHVLSSFVFEGLLLQVAKTSESSSVTKTTKKKIINLATHIKTSISLLSSLKH